MRRWGREAAAWAAVAVIAALGNFLLGCYCGGGGGGGGYDGRFAEVEPNDTEGTATDLGTAGFVEFKGSCGSTTNDDFFSAAITTTGYLFAEVSWDDPDYNVDVAVYGSGWNFADTAVPPDDTPIQVDGTALTAGTVYVHVTCTGDGGNGTDYVGVLDGPP